MLDDTVREMTNTLTQLGEELVRLHSRVQTILTPEQRAKNAEWFGKFCHELKRLNVSLPTETNLAAPLPGAGK